MFIQAHIWLPADRKEYLWAEQNAMKHNDWYWTGIWCSLTPSRDITTFYTTSGEDMRVINKKLNVRVHEPGGTPEWPVARIHR